MTVKIAEYLVPSLLTFLGAGMKNPSIPLSKTLSTLIFSSFILIGCSSVDTDATYKNKRVEKMYENGSVLSAEGGIKLFDTTDKKKANNIGLGVNGFLWRAALDTLAFLPIASADPFGGVITTDWHSTEVAKNERVRLNVLILDRELRADGVTVVVFRQIKEDGGDWEQSSVARATASSLEEAILSRARQLRLAQKKMED